MVLLHVLRSTPSTRVKAALARAIELAHQLAAGQSPTSKGAGSDEQLTQVRGQDGSVIALSRDVAGEVPATRLRPGHSPGPHSADQ